MNTQSNIQFVKANRLPFLETVSNTLDVLKAFPVPFLILASIAVLPGNLLFSEPHAFKTAVNILFSSLANGAICITTYLLFLKRDTPPPPWHATLAQTLTSSFIVLTLILIIIFSTIQTYLIHYSSSSMSSHTAFFTSFAALIGIFLMLIACTTTIPICAIEQIDPIACFKKSFILLNGHKLQVITIIAGAMLLIAAPITLLLQSLIFKILQVFHPLGEDQPFSWPYTTVVISGGILLQAFFSTLCATIYCRLSSRQETEV